MWHLSLRAELGKQSLKWDNFEELNDVCFSSLACLMTCLLSLHFPTKGKSIFSTIYEFNSFCGKAEDVTASIILVVVTIVFLLWVTFLQTCWKKPTGPVWQHSPQLHWETVHTCAVTPCMCSVSRGFASEPVNATSWICRKSSWFKSLMFVTRNMSKAAREEIRKCV